MKTKLRLISLCTLIVSFGFVSQAQADYASYDNDSDEQQVSYDYARVVRSQPIYETVEVDVGREVCRNEPVRYSAPVRQRRSNAGPVLGAIIGGVIGNQFGRGHGRAAATVAGVALGSAIAEDAERESDYRDSRRARQYVRQEQVCEYQPEIRRQRELVGYDVTYDYKGQIGRVTTRNQPGSTIRVEVAVTAIED